VGEPALSVAVHSGDLAPLAPAFAALDDAGDPGAVFRSYAWLSTWWHHFGAGRRLHVLVARDGADVVGLLPLYRARTPLGPALRMMGDGIVGSDHLGAIARATEAPRVARAFADTLLAAPRIELAGLAASGALVAALGRSPRVAVRRGPACPWVRLDGDFTTYLAARPDGTARQLARRRRWLEQRRGFAVEVYAEPRALDHALDPLFALHHARWSLDELGSQAIDSPAVEAFHRDAARALARLGWARVYLLTVEGAPRAALYAFCRGRRLAYYQSGHDPAWRRRSVGTVLLAAVIEQAFAAGLAEVDLLHGEEAYKRRWATDERELTIVAGRGPGLVPWLSCGARQAGISLRQAAKDALPAPARRWARRARRELDALWRWR
jgi:CelD/BcsL family acetyltransferase involved in cellulose biosynthesis